MYTYHPGNTVWYNGIIYVCITINVAQTPTNTAYWQPLTTLTVLFSPTGAVSKVYYNACRLSVTDPIYLLIGKRDRAANNFVVNNGNALTQTNWQDLNDLWMTINAQTGQINTEPVASSTGALTEASGIGSARQLAQQGQGTGGK